MVTVSSLNKKITYPVRLFLWLLGYSLLLVGSFIFFQYHREKEVKQTELNLQLQLINRFILTQIREGKDIRDLGRDEFPPFGNLRISLFDKQGYLVYDNILDSIPHTNHRNRVEIREARAKGAGFAVHRHSESTGETYFYSATSDAGGNVVRTAIPYTLTLVSLLRADYGFLWMMGVVTLVMCILGYFATRRVGQHIIRLDRFAEKAERGDRISDVESFPDDELGRISRHIVRLYAGLQQANADRDREHRAALHEQREKERIKKQLTNNINHELKTPVASIQVCLETLINHPEMDAGRRMDFLARSISHCERLKSLLADVSLITRMDDGGTAITKERIDLADIIAECVADKRPRAEKSGIDITCDIAGPIHMNGNQTLLLSVFNNLLDNAIIYSGGNRISVGAASVTGDTITLSVADNGCGVPAEHLPRLFERFYRIDKGRSRAAGGTGLGLAIVKNAIMLHGGNITARNRNGGGLEFTITLATDSR